MRENREGGGECGEMEDWNGMEVVGCSVGGREQEGGGREVEAAERWRW